MRILTVLTFLSLQFGHGWAQLGDRHLDKRLKKIYKESNFPGFAISVIKCDSVLFSKSYGYADKYKKTPYTLETIQPVASVSKTLIALALMKSIELGYFTLETDINDVLPFSVTNPNFPEEVISVKHLATHTSSLVDDEEVYHREAYQMGHTPTVELGDFLEDYYTTGGKLYSTQNFSAANVGTAYAYSNMASALMAYIIEHTSATSFADFTEKHIFQPLGMSHTHWFYNQNYEDKYATLYQIDKPESPLEAQILNADNSYKPYSCITYPDGSLRTSVHDLTKFVQTMMKGYFTDDVNVINKDAYKTLFEKRFSEQAMPANMEKSNMAIFWSISQKGRVSHTGSSPGVFSFVSFDPETETGRVMTLNASVDGEDNVATVRSLEKVVRALEKFEETLK